MSRYLFLYGTLLPGHAPVELASAIARLRWLGEGSVPGRLYDLGEYPGAVLDPPHQGTRAVDCDPEAATAQVHGTVFELPDDADVLSALDGYEGFDPEDLEASLFVRTIQPVTLAGGKTLQCWMYLYNRDPGGARRIPSGRYRGSRELHE